MNHADLTQLLADPSVLPRSTKILQESGLRSLVLHLKSGEAIPEHQTRGALIVQCLRGDVQFSTKEESFHLREGLLISLPPGMPHALTARQDSLLLLTMSEPAPAV
jgi:quercetin dioxygenase-like cupin family protein